MQCIFSDMKTPLNSDLTHCTLKCVVETYQSNYIDDENSSGIEMSIPVYARP